MIRLVFLGTSGGVPTKERGLPAVGIRYMGRVLLFDCGEGTQMRLMQAKLSYGKISDIMISHVHGDHVLGLPGLLQTMATTGRSSRLTIWAPKDQIENIEKLVYATIDEYPFPISIKHPRGEFLEGKKFSIRAFPLLHSIPTVGFSFLGKTKIVYAPDTRPCESVIKEAKDAILIHDSTYSDTLKSLAEERMHSTAKEAAMVAREGGASVLFLFHFSPRYKELRCLLEEARSVFTNSFIAEDLLELRLKG